MNGKAKGSRAERRVIRILEAAGYICTKAGGSLGLFDVDDRAVRPALVQVKVNEYLSAGRTRAVEGARDADASTYQRPRLAHTW